MSRYRVMCHPQADGTEFYSIQQKGWFLWYPLGHNDEADMFHLAKYRTQWEAIEVARKMTMQEGMVPYPVWHSSGPVKGPS